MPHSATVHPPSSLRRIAASRANGRLSRGPKTELGRQTSCANNRKHGLAATPENLFFLPGESQAHFESLRTQLLRECHPQTAYEQTLIEIMATSHWLNLRAIAYGTSALNAEIALQDPTLPAPMRAAVAFRNIANTKLATAHRFEIKYDRLYHRAQTALLKAQNLQFKPDSTFENGETTILQHEPKHHRKNMILPLDPNPTPEHQPAVRALVAPRTNQVP